MTRHGDSLLAVRLSALADPRDDSNWEDVLQRALEQRLERGRRFPGRRTLLIAAVVATLMIVVGFALAATLGGFSDWLTGKPGSPASQTEQRVFEQANARSWASFPSGTKLRRLIVTRADGSTFRLLGFSSGDEICLRFTVDGAKQSLRMSCIPRRQLVNAKAPAVAAMVDISAGKIRSVLTSNRIGRSKQRVKIPSSLVSFGITADGVSSVEVRIRGRNRRALVENNAFLLVRPNAYSYKAIGKVSKIVAVNATGERISIPLACVFCGSPKFSHVKTRFGPTRIERKPQRRTISWLYHHEPRGLSLSGAGIPHPRRWLRGHRPVEFVRVLQPDPLNHARVIIWLWREPVWRGGKRTDRTRLSLCFSAISGLRTNGFACGGNLRNHPFAVMEQMDASSQQSMLISGAASDSVSRIDLFLNKGERWRVPLKDNVFVISAPRTGFPAKLVGYDTQGKVVAIQDLT
ncbi:MAG: hypothetical protein WBQ14_01285 [Gaiellaceae bacterium]